MIEGGAGRETQMVSWLREKRTPINTGWLIAYNYEGKRFLKLAPKCGPISSVPCSVITASTEECFIAGTDHAGPCRQK